MELVELTIAKLACVQVSSLRENSCYQVGRSTLKNSAQQNLLRKSVEQKRNSAQEHNVTIDSSCPKGSQASQVPGGSILPAPLIGKNELVDTCLVVFIRLTVSA